MDLKTWLRAEWDRVAGYTLIGLGALCLLLGYLGVSDSPYVAEGLSYVMSGGIGGLFLLGAGATLLITADLHDGWRKLDRVEQALRETGAVPTVPAAAPVPGAEEQLDADPEPEMRQVALATAKPAR